MAGKRLVRQLYQRALAALVGGYAPLARLQTLLDPPAGGPPRRILVIRLGLIGDGILLTPALRLLRDNFPLAQIDVLATPVQRALLEPLTSIDRLLVWEAGDLFEPRVAVGAWRWRSAARSIVRLRRERYDLALSCYGALGSAIALLCGAPKRIGYAAEAVPGVLTHALPGGRWDRPWHDAEYNVEVARAAGATGVTPATELELGPAPPSSSAACAEPDAGGPLVVLHTGAVNGRAKRWPFEHWRTLVDHLRADGCRLLFVGAGDEDARFAARVASDDENLVGKTTLTELAHALSLADVVVTADSGPMHVATALRRPVVAIFGPTDPLIYGPFRPERAVVVRHELPCQPCYRLDRVADCPLGHTLCQRRLPPQRVHAAVRSVLDERPNA